MPPTPNPAPVRLPWYSVATGAIILIGFASLVFYLVSVSGVIGKDEQMRWDRLMLIFNAVQTLTVAAAGVLLGTTVQQARVASAEARADAAEGNAKAAQSDAEKAAAARRLIDGLDPPGGAGDAALAQIRAVLSV
ncbi:hypothetical protein [Novosphingobium sp. BW1]|uniref:hypothetical protein n=1 Tax=Novosphingobium sp. BW1 TaxID=2592621 RepID=UPI0011DEDBFC|nr:hypothetical protein [Novosphingobium sp. BW1]TYC78766.1 hypothetical protein FMM79_20685 [Novosphingobium sp. BW1]